MPAIDWNEDHPSDSSLVAQAPAYLRNVWKNISLGLGESMEWPGSAGGSDASQGELKQGSARAHFAAFSASSYGDGTGRGRLFLASDTSKLYGYGDDVGSRATYQVGTPYFIEHADAFPGTVWVQDGGSYDTDTGSGVIAGRVAFNVTYATDLAPLVFINSDNTNQYVQVSASHETNFESNVSGPTGSNTYRWVSFGTVSL